jgi:ABC-2 type transport system ATP-binding protein
MTAIIEARGLTKRYGNTPVVRGADLNVEAGRIVGLIGPNGAGKTTVIKSILGLTSFDGELKVLGRDPRTERDALMEEVCFIADVAVLPRWIKVSQAVDFVAGVHPRFDRKRAEDFLSRTDIKKDSKVRQLSKGMVTQVHLALILAIDAKLLVLDEPTLGLDLLFRRSFYDNLLNDYFNKERTILVTTHQVEEIENILTDVLFIEHGKIVLNTPMDSLGERFAQLIPSAGNVDRARALKPFWEREIFGRVAMLFDGRDQQELAVLGEVRAPSVADLFVAMMQPVGTAQSPSAPSKEAA